MEPSYRRRAVEALVAWRVSRTPEKPKNRPPTGLPLYDAPADSDDADRSWYADGLRFKCTTCGNCCTGPAGYVWITDEEIAQLAHHLKLDEAIVRKNYVRKVGRRMSLKEIRNEQGDYDCVFLKPLPGDRPGSRKRGCSVYPARPLQCRTWPFWHGTLDSEEAWRHAKRTCPGLDSRKGKLYGVKEIDALRDAEEWPEDPPSSK